MLKSSKLAVALVASGLLSSPAFANNVFIKRVDGIQAEAVNQTRAVSMTPSSGTFPDTTEGHVSSGIQFTVTANPLNNRPVESLSFSTMGDFSGVTSCGTSLNPGQSCIATVTFTPSSAGAKSGMLVLTSNGNPSSVSANLFGTGLAATWPQLGVSSNTLAFGTATTPLTQTITNTGTANLVIGSLSIGGTNAGDFSLVSGQDNCSGHTLAPNATCTVKVGFAPTVAGARTAAVTIPDNTTGSPHSFNLTGTGSLSLAVSPATQAFGSVIAGTASTSQASTITNDGNMVATISSASYSDATFSTNATGTTCGATPYSLNPGASCTYNIKATPAATGSYSGNLNLAWDNAQTKSVSLSVTGIDAPDPYWANTVLLMHFDGNFTDVLGHTVSTVNGLANPSATGAKFGSSALFATNQYLSTSSGTELNFGTGDFTIEGWFKVPDTTAVRRLLGVNNGSNNAPGWQIHQNASFWGFFDGVHWINVGIPATNTWFHMAIVRHGSSIMTFRDGTLINTTTGVNWNIGYNTTLGIGKVIGDNSNAEDAQGVSFDELRITKGVARYIASFTAPTKAFASNADANNKIYVTHASYGNNVAWSGNRTSQLRTLCDGQSSCTFNPLAWGDPYVGTAKSLVVTYNCGSTAKTYNAAAEAGDRNHTISCP